jgi:CHRD domain
MKLITGTLSSIFLVAMIGLSGCEKTTSKVVFVKKDMPVNSAQETPAHAATGRGTIDAEYSKASKTLTYTVKWSGLTGPLAAGHIHGTAERGYIAPVLQSFSGIPNPTLYGTSGTYSGFVQVDGIIIKEEDILGGKYYINLHTAAYPGGEIRGQIDFN